MAGLILVAGSSACLRLLSHLDWWFDCTLLAPPPLSLCVLLSNLRCDASCLTCVGPSWGNCSSCSGDHGLLDGVCVVNTRCTEGQSTVFRLERALARRCVIKLSKL